MGHTHTNPRIQQVLLEPLGPELRENLPAELGLHFPESTHGTEV